MVKIDLDSVLCPMLNTGLRVIIIWCYNKFRMKNNLIFLQTFLAVAKLITIAVTLTSDCTTFKQYLGSTCLPTKTKLINNEIIMHECMFQKEEENSKHSRLLKNLLYTDSVKTLQVFGATSRAPKQELNLSSLT
jgi:hypothetical protein